jgi:hypothetical protein
MFGRARFMAIVALVAMCGLVVAVIAFLLRNAAYVLLGLAGAAISVGGAWWFLARRRYRRAIGAAGLVGGLGVVVAALVWAGIGGEQLLARLIVVACVLAVGVSAGRSAVLGTIRTTAAMPFRRRLPPSHPVLICNPWSGNGKVEKFGLLDLAKSLGVETVLLARGLDLEQLARAATAPRLSWRRSRSSTTSRSCASRPVPETTSLSTSASTATIRGRRCTRSATAWSGGSTSQQ